ncbi:hypothetical protein BpHYR1_000658 [Brachionus plicatilis]|uniref:Uncharacterized protein n=1 Tax=Brachionus plicatilis TaxID=10195 RepID=A0A3M7SGM0_BRAPC|nr:hypothetical protein BpHYR1_000658 [Brachionus plicatilis]
MFNQFGTDKLNVIVKFCPEKYASILRFRIISKFNRFNSIKEKIAFSHYINVRIFLRKFNHFYCLNGNFSSSFLISFEAKDIALFFGTEPFVLVNRVVKLPNSVVTAPNVNSLKKKLSGWMAINYETTAMVQ